LPFAKPNVQWTFDGSTPEGEEPAAFYSDILLCKIKCPVDIWLSYTAEAACDLLLQYFVLNCKLVIISGFFASHKILGGEDAQRKPESFAFYGFFVFIAHWKQVSVRF
jgi:hypothetical protein